MGGRKWTALTQRIKRYTLYAHSLLATRQTCRLRLLPQHGRVHISGYQTFLYDSLPIELHCVSSEQWVIKQMQFAGSFVAIDIVGDGAKTSRTSRRRKSSQTHAKIQFNVSIFLDGRRTVQSRCTIGKHSITTCLLAFGEFGTECNCLLFPLRCSVCSMPSMSSCQPIFYST